MPLSLRKLVCDRVPKVVVVGHFSADFALNLKSIFFLKRKSSHAKVVVIQIRALPDYFVNIVGSYAGTQRIPFELEAVLHACLAKPMLKKFSTI